VSIIAPENRPFCYKRVHGVELCTFTSEVSLSLIFALTAMFDPTEGQLHWIFEYHVK